MCEAASRLRSYAALGLGYVRSRFAAPRIRRAASLLRKRNTARFFARLLRKRNTARFFARLLRKRNTACGCAMPPVACGNSRAYAHLFGWASQTKLFSSWHVICIYSNFRRLHHEVIS